MVLPSIIKRGIGIRNHRLRCGWEQEKEKTTVPALGVGYKINQLPPGSTLHPSANKAFLIYSREKQSYYLRTFEIEAINPENQISSEYSYPRAFAKMNYK